MLCLQEAGGSAAIAQRVAAGTATKQDRKLLLASQKQDRLLYICTYLLLNLAEDPAIERKMHKKVSPWLSCTRLQLSCAAT